MKEVDMRETDMKKRLMREVVREVMMMKTTMIR